MSTHEEGRSIKPEDLFRLKFLQGAQVSPDGRSAVYATSHIGPDKDASEDDPDARKEYVALWLIDLAGGEARQFTMGTARDTNPQWSPDGSQIAFLSTRDGKPQIYVIPVGGGEARAVTSLKQGASGGAV